MNRARQYFNHIYLGTSLGISVLMVLIELINC